MTGFSRRGFIKVAGVGVATGVGAAALPAVSAAAAAPPAAAPPASAAVPAISAHRGTTGSLVAHVKDLSGGKISLLVGDREFHVTDRKLVAALAEAVESARRS